MQVSLLRYLLHGGVGAKVNFFNEFRIFPISEQRQTCQLTLLVVLQNFLPISFTALQLSVTISTVCNIYKFSTFRPRVSIAVFVRFYHSVTLRKSISIFFSVKFHIDKSRWQLFASFNVSELFARVTSNFFQCLQVQYFSSQL